MISSRTLALALTLILLAVLPAYGIFDCCRRHTDKKFKVSQVGMFKDYYHQDSNGVCDIDAIVFTVNISRPCKEPKSINLCADPKQNWAKNMISAMNKQIKKSMKRQQRKRQKQCKRTKKTQQYNNDGLRVEAP